MPDLSHLTEEERKIIESVIQRQREEEEKEQEILRLADSNNVFVGSRWGFESTSLLLVQQRKLLD